MSMTWPTFRFYQICQKILSFMISQIILFFFIGIKLSDEDFAQYKNFPVVVSSRWQQEVCETVWDIVNADRDRDDERLTDKQSKAFRYAQEWIG